MATEPREHALPPTPPPPLTLLHLQLGEGIGRGMCYVFICGNRLLLFLIAGTIPLRAGVVVARGLHIDGSLQGIRQAAEKKQKIFCSCNYPKIIRLLFVYSCLIIAVQCIPSLCFMSLDFLFAAALFLELQ